ncbi:putative sulfoacetate--CoA ligase [Cupriavidus laharis]|uniref:Sulfoacetate--CoA ligase n=1 Tax=Cupriavidus laharis TaxID=151654 RepID=A0ABM8X574_9BURK|nr:acyl--CoA ligase [Cupriavidus laharis]CAG9175045.1 putative sulfoacetate--CoA ligase [Cupriavidus laharis]
MNARAEPQAFESLATLMATRAVQWPDKPYLLAPDSGHALTFGSLAADADALSQHYAAAGLENGQTVSVYLPNGEQTARLLLGSMACGLVINPINLLCQPAQLRYILSHSDTRLIFTWPGGEAAIREALRAAGLDVPVVVTTPDAASLPALPKVRPDASALPPADPHAPALLMYTSGTTGTPKGVLLTHHNLATNGANVSREHDLGPADRVLATLPLYHINGLVVTAIAPLVHGGSVVMPMRFSASSFWKDITRHGCTWLNVVPTIIAYLLNDPDGKAPEGVRFCRSASAALPPEHHRAFEERFGIGVIETMGMTETAAPAFSNPLDPQHRRIGSIGRPSGTRARVLGRDGKPLRDGQIGEIVLQGENVMAGYYKAPDVTRDAFTHDGWLRTGDLGYRDADGYFYITGRAKELIIKGGENIAPREIDEALLRHPSVLEAAAVGVPDPAYGQEIVAFVVMRDATPCDDAALRAHCLRELGRYKTPKEFRFIAELPRGPSGKVQRLKLLDPA